MKSNETLCTGQTLVEWCRMNNNANENCRFSFVLSASSSSTLFLETFQNWINLIECIVDFLTYFGTGKYDFARHKNQQHNSWFDHTIDETGK